MASQPPSRGEEYACGRRKHTGASKRCAARGAGQAKGHVTLWAGGEEVGRGGVGGEGEKLLALPGCLPPSSDPAPVLALLCCAKGTGTDARTAD